MYRQSPLLSALLVAFLIGACPSQQRAGQRRAARTATTDNPAQEIDWPATVAKAHEHRRIMLRRAAAAKIAHAGDHAVAAVRAYEQKNGRPSIKLELLSAYASSKATGAATLALLEEWARDRDFFWRSQALQALANRRLPQYEKLFRSHLEDAAYLTRIEAGRGLCLLGVGQSEVLALLRDADPRVRMRVAICLVEEKDDRGLPTLVEALRQDAGFLDYPWGPLGARAAYQVLREVAGQDFGFVVGEKAAKNAPAIAKFAAFARQRLGERWVEPVPAHRDELECLGGIAIRSCRNGDLFVRFGTDRRVVFGLEAEAEVALPAPVWTRLWESFAATGEAVEGQVICDYLRLVCNNPTVDKKFAPGSMPTKNADWLEAVATALEKKGRADLSQQIRSRLEQFTSR